MMLCFIALAISLVSTTLNALSSSLCDRVQDSLALVALFNSTAGESWENKWDLSTAISQWYGIGLDLFFDQLSEYDIPSEVLACAEDVLLLGSSLDNSDLIWTDGVPNGERIIKSSGAYRYTIISGLCEVSNTVIVSITDCTKEECPLYIPNAVAYSSVLDENESLRIHSRCLLDEYRVEVFDRCGSSIYKSNNIDASWDLQFKNQEMMPGI